MVQGQRKGAGFVKERFFWMLFSAVLVAAIIGFFLHGAQLRSRLQEAEAEREILLAQCKASIGSSLLSSWDIAQLKRRGISNPEEDLAADLMQHRELIPYKGVMGGTMGFYSKQDIHVLNTRWVLASFEDGHIGGNMLLEYAVSPGGEIQWKVISAYLD
jgi:hypothetical protein